MRCTIAFLVLLFSGSSLAQVSVGWDAACDYDVNSDAAALQNALDAGHAEIRLTHQEAYAGAIDIEQDVVLRGGFVDCTAANSSTQDNIRAVIDAAGLDRTAVRINGIDQADSRLELLTIINGDGTGSNDPGGIEITNLTGNLALHTLDIRDNAGSTGGGVSVYANSLLEQGSLLVEVTDTAIRNNSATRGGGVACDTFHSDVDIQVELHSGSTLRHNHATVDGGAIRMQSCQLDFEAGSANAVVGSNLDEEIFQNTSDKSGGGLAIFSNARVSLRGTEVEAFNVFGNQSNLDESVSGSGGAALVGSSAELEMSNTLVSNNSSGRYGGALAASFEGRIVMRRDPAGCSYAVYCSQIVGNRLTRTFPGGGGALSVRFGGQISVFNTLFSGNNADDQGYIGFAEQSANGQEATLLLEGNVLVENANLVDDLNPTGLHINSDAHATLAYNTFLRNKTGSVILSQQNGSSMQVIGNILHEFGNIHQASGTTDTEINCNLVRSLSTIEVPVVDTLEGEPDYVDSSTDDLRLAAGDTMAMDLCSDSLYMPGSDINGHARGLDNPAVTDLNGPFDVGANEFSPANADVIFSDSFGSF